MRVFTDTHKLNVFLLALLRGPHHSPSFWAGRNPDDPPLNHVSGFRHNQLVPVGTMNEPVGIPKHWLVTLDVLDWHSCFLRCTSSFLEIAGDASGHRVVPS